MLKNRKYLLRQLLALITILVGIIFLSRKMNVFPLIDYVEYWSAGKINLAGGNPYSKDEMIIIENQLGWSYPDVLMMWNPPWILTVAMPLSLINYPASRMIWFLLELFLLVYSTDMLWKVYSGSPSKRWIAWITTLCFGPTLHALKTGQITPFILLGSVGFLFFLQKKKPFWAGVMASLIFLKPHLLYLLIITIILWSVRTKNWKILIGMMSGIIIPLLIASLPNLHLIEQYIYAIKFYPPENWQTATLGTPLRYLFGQELFFLQFTSSVIGFTWLLIYWMINHKKWDWSTTFPLIIVVSTATAAYGWTHDVMVIIPAIVHVMMSINFRKWTIKSTIIILTFWYVNFLSLTLNLPQHLFWWLSSFYLVWYICAAHWIIKPKKNLVYSQDSLIKSET
jgi:hypothetical protein